MPNLFEIKVKLYITKNITNEESSAEIVKLIDASLLQDATMKTLHEERGYKPYVMNSFYPIEKDCIYKEGKIYTVIIRTISQSFKQHCETILCNTYTDRLKVLSVTVNKWRTGIIDKVYSITPIVLKFDDTGYWKNQYTVADFERLLKDNLYKKYKHFFSEEIVEEVELYTNIQLDNKKPIGMKYKNVTLLGDKVTIHVAANETAQKLFFMALGTGIGHNNSRGAGFINAKFY
ncbi:CRISPR-associated endoribonuclease Cas6 [Caryophanon tenue]|uniref:CRISPR-associated endoribonuclease Cas6 n=1 Tax=Caryophanon tenue TaxID=33978 RepID=A0A1C0YHL1_9BACL|nr:CRISPR-associated endoribonuclease Cas6 [Caryophanon tenue]OCS86665.1 CRISPR-associated endoribonuclease Cas6 [Caryophanon tenue]